MPEIIPQTVPAEHVLGAALMDVHPSNGRRYYGVCEKQGGTNQDFVVYRRDAYPATQFVEVARLDGAGRDADAFITMGGAKVLPNGALEVWASGQPKGVTDNSGTGFTAIGMVFPGIDDPFPLWSVKAPAEVPTHIDLNPPAGYRPYGANQSFALSAEVVDGLPVYFIAQEGWGYSPDNSGFGEYVFKQVGGRKAEYVRYNGADVPDGRGDLYIAGNGKLYITGNESDDRKLPSIYEVPGFVPFTDAVLVAVTGQTTGGSVDLTAVNQQLVSLQRQIEQVSAAAAAAMARANYVKGIFEPVWGELEKLDNRPIGVTREEAWQLAADRAFVEVTTVGSGVHNAILGMVAPGTQTVDLGPVNSQLAELAKNVNFLEKTRLTVEDGTRVAANVVATAMVSDVFAAKVKSLATEVLVAAIDYARSVAKGSTTSRLRVLIETIIKGN